MNELTQEQADRMRALRSSTIDLEEAMVEVVDEVCKLCDHDLDGQPSASFNCPTCCLWSKVCELTPLVVEFVREFDDLLTRGPAPKEMP